MLVVLVTVLIKDLLLIRIEMRSSPTTMCIPSHGAQGLLKLRPRLPHHRRAIDFQRRWPSGAVGFRVAVVASSQVNEAGWGGARWGEAKCDVEVVRDDVGWSG